METMTQSVWAGLLLREVRILGPGTCSPSAHTCAEKHQRQVFRRPVIVNWEDQTKYLLESLTKGIRYSTSNKINYNGHLWINVSWIKDSDYPVKA